jgi:hypothetical protein
LTPSQPSSITLPPLHNYYNYLLCKHFLYNIHIRVLYYREFFYITFSIRIFCGKFLNISANNILLKFVNFIVGLSFWLVIHAAFNKRVKKWNGWLKVLISYNCERRHQP